MHPEAAVSVIAAKATTKWPKEPQNVAQLKALKEIESIHTARKGPESGTLHPRTSKGRCCCREWYLDRNWCDCIISRRRSFNKEGVWCAAGGRQRFLRVLQRPLQFSDAHVGCRLFEELCGAKVTIHFDITPRVGIGVGNTESCE